jgi:hypothetical protein
LLAGLFSVRDSLRKARVDFALPKLVDTCAKIAARRGRDDDRFLLLAARWLLKQAAEHADVSAWLDANRDKTRWHTWQAQFYPGSRR